MSSSVDDGFVFHRFGVGRHLVCRDLAPLAAHCFTARERTFCGSGTPSDYADLARHFGVADTEVVRLRQVHSARVVAIRPGDPIDEHPEADAVLSLDPHRVISVRVADCVPILLADRRGRLVGAVHAGWRGTVARVAQLTVQAIVACGVPPDDLVAAVGPAAGACCYQVDRTVYDRFAEAWPEHPDWLVPDGGEHWRLDLASVNGDQLVAAGLPSGAIHRASRCTIHESASWHSHRREGTAAGRMVAAIRLRQASA